MKFTSYREEYGAGEEGTKKLVKKYKKDTPGQEVKEVYADSGLGKWFGKGGKGGTTKGGWDRYNTKGEKIGKCGDRTAKEGKPKCLSAAKAAKMSKKEIANAVRRKRKADPSTDRPGTGNKPINVSNRIGEEKNPRIPRKPGQPAGSKKHSDLYTDENPEGTIHGLGFKNVATAKASVSKIKKSDRTHAHKIQAAVAMEQRAREMGKSSEAAVYRSYIDSMKKKTKQRNEDWSDKYKRSIDCDNPKGFSQRAHCAGRKKNEETTMKSFKSYISETKDEDFLNKMNPEPTAKEMDAALKDKEYDKKLDAIRAKKKKNNQSMNEGVPKSMDQGAALKVYDKLKKGSKVTVQFGGAMSSTKEPLELVVSSPHRIVGKSKVGRIILKNPSNMRGMKYTLYNRDGKISLAQGDMATIMTDLKIVKESVEGSEKKKMPYIDPTKVKFRIPDRRAKIKLRDTGKKPATKPYPKLPGESKKLDEKSPAWQRKEGKNKEGGLNAAGRRSYERENPGSDLKAPVSAAQAKRSKGGKAAKRRKSFCARMGGMPGPMKDEKGRPTRKALALRKWDC